MERIISKELLSEVLGYEVEEVKDVMDSTLYFNNTKHGDYINIYELAHKCKEWLRSNGFMITIFYHLDTIAVNISFDGSDVYWTPSMTVYTELDAITKACQWILDNKDQ